MIVGIGIDICELARFEAAEQRRPGFARRWLTAREAGLSLASRAGRFAAKEALAKALLAEGGLGWHDVWVVNDEFGRPTLRVTGTVLARARQLGVDALHLSISHDGGLASAVVVAEHTGAAPLADAGAPDANEPQEDPR